MLKDITTPMETLISQGRATEAMSVLERRQRFLQQGDRGGGGRREETAAPPTAVISVEKKKDEEKKRKVVLVTVSSGTSGQADVRFFYASGLACGETQAAFEEEVEGKVKELVWRGGGGGEGGGGDSNGEGGGGGGGKMTMTVNLKPPLSLRKTVLKLTEKMATLGIGGGEGEGGIGKEGFDVLVNVVASSSSSSSSST